MTTSLSRSVSRRDAIRWILGAAATVSALDLKAAGPAGLPTGIGTDPNLLKGVAPWDRVLTAAEKKTVTALCDLIIPADERSPSASAVGVPDFIDEWVSAPYEQQAADLQQIRAGLVWLDAKAKEQFHKTFAELDETGMRTICDPICLTARATPECKEAAAFFSRFRELTAGGFYTSPEGWKDLGYIGNVPLTEFPGPPPEVRRHLGLD